MDRRLFISGMLFLSAPAGLAGGTPGARASELATLESDPLLGPRLGKHLSVVMRRGTHKSAIFPIKFERTSDHQIYARIVAVHAALAQSLEVLHERSPVPTLGDVLVSLGGDGDVGKKATPWRAAPLQSGPCIYRIRGYSWYFGSARGDHIRVGCSRFDKGLAFSVDTNDGGVPSSDVDTDFDDKVAQVVLLFEGAATAQISYRQINCCEHAIVVS